MSGRGAPIGNTNATKSKPFYDAVRRAIAQDDGKRLRDAAEKLLTLAATGEAWAVKELADRIDGKSVQALTVAGEDGGPVRIEAVERRIVNGQNP